MTDCAIIQHKLSRILVGYIERYMKLDPCPAIKRLDEIDARAAAATPGPMHAVAMFVRDEYDRDVLTVAEDWAYRSEPEEPPRTEYDWRADAEFFAHARTDVPALVALVRALLAEREVVRKGGFDWFADYEKAFCVAEADAAIRAFEEGK